MPTNLTDVDTFTATIAVPASADARTAASVQTPFQGLANRTRYLKNAHDAYVAATDAVLARLAGLSASSDNRVLSSMNAQPQTGWDPNSYGAWIASVGDVGLFLPLDSADFPDGCTITGFRVRVNPGAARSGFQRMYAQLGMTTIAQSTTTLSAQIRDDATANEQNIDASGLSVTLNRSMNHYWLHVRSGATAATYNDLFLGAYVSRTLP